VTEIIVWVNNVWKIYRDPDRGIVEALKGVTFTVSRGEIIAIHGPSGSGKTTLLKILAGLERPDRGEVIVEAYNLNYLDESGLAMLRNTIVGYIPQDYGLIDDLTVFENIELPLLLAGFKKEERHYRVSELINYIGLRGKEKAKPKQLSGGERRRVAIARALSNTPSILLADEPTANLDWSNAIKVLELFEKVRQDFRTTIIIVTHDPRVLKFADRSYTLIDGILTETSQEYLDRI